jgi:hypothetical protein
MTGVSHQLPLFMIASLHTGFVLLAEDGFSPQGFLCRYLVMLPVKSSNFESQRKKKKFFLTHPEV